jgi:hypothetical protein
MQGGASAPPSKQQSRSLVDDDAVEEEEMPQEIDRSELVHTGERQAPLAVESDAANPMHEADPDDHASTYDLLTSGLWTDKPGEQVVDLALYNPPPW